MNSFKDFNLSESIVKALEAIDITTPTPVQVKVIPPALEGKNILASAQTGTGKTIAYLTPILEKLRTAHGKKAIILTPTRELAVQVQASARRLLGAHPHLSTALLIGGEPLPRQLRQLRKKPRLIIGTPGRVNDLLDRGVLKLNDATFFVLDEVDRMLDMGFSVQLETIVDYIPEERQTLMLSATMPKNIEDLAKKYLENPERIVVGTENKPVAKIKQDTIKAKNSEKLGLLTEELTKREGSVIVFVKTKYKADQLANTLRTDGHRVRAIHGGLRQQKRDKVIKDFRDSRSRILVATDIAARGLDVPHIEHVVNYDLPQCPEDYLHRIGRTGRAGAEGSAVSFVSPDEQGKWNAIGRLMSDNEFEGTGFSRPAPSRGRRRPFGDKKRSFRDRSFKGRGEREYRDGKSFSRGEQRSRSFERDEQRGRSFDRGEQRGRSFDRGEQRGRSFDRGEQRERSFGRKRSSNFEVSFSHDREHSSSYDREDTRSRAPRGRRFGNGSNARKSGFRKNNNRPFPTSNAGNKKIYISES